MIIFFRIQFDSLVVANIFGEDDLDQMETKLRAQNILLKKAIAEKEEIIKAMKENPVNDFLESIASGLDFARLSKDDQLATLWRFQEALKKDLQVPGNDSMPSLPLEIARNAYLGLLKMQNQFHAIEELNDLYERIMTVTKAVVLYLEDVGDDQNAISKYFGYLSILLHNFHKSEGCCPLLNTKELFADTSGPKTRPKNNDLTGAALIRRLLKPDHYESKKPVMVYCETQTESQAETGPRTTADEDKDLTLQGIRLQQYSTTIQELWSKFKE